MNVRGVQARRWCAVCFKADMHQDDLELAAAWHALCTGRVGGGGVCECPCRKPAVR